MNMSAPRKPRADIDMRAFAKSAGATARFGAGATIFNQGDPGDCMYIVQSGMIEMVVGDRVVETVGPNEALGFMSMIDDQQRTSTARAKEACELSQIDWDKLKAKTEQIGYPIIAVVNQINANCRDKLGEYCHWGATTQDITDTAAVLQMREGLALVEQDLDEIADALATLAKAYRDTPVIGRSNLQQATPITFGYKMASILAGIERHRERLQQLKPRVLMGEFGGASGTLSSLETGAMETQAALMKELGLAQPLISWHTVRDTIAEVGCFLALVGGSLEIETAPGQGATLYVRIPV